MSASALTLLPMLSAEGADAFAALQRTGAPAAPKVFTRPQYAAVQALADAIIPADDRSPGAKQARVADYIDLLLSESDITQRQRWLDGLGALEAFATEQHGSSIARLGAPALDRLLADVSRNEKNPATPAERFFVTMKNATIQGYYTSEIGIHKELQYKGNQFLPEFVGCLTEDGKDCPHCGQKATDTETASVP